MDRKLSASIKSLIYILEKNSKFNFKALIGFDGFIIEHLNAVKRGNNLNDYTKIHSLKEFNILAVQSALSGVSLELVPIKFNPGGNGPAMSSSLTSYGFDLTYIGEDGEKHRPVMLHRVIFGSIERFIGIITEHFAGAFPTWLAPVQIQILPISEKHIEYSAKLKKHFESLGFRVELDDRNEKIGYKIREAQLSKVPYMLIIGDKEIQNNEVGVRSRKDGDIGAMKIEDFAKKIEEEIKNFAR